ncbi:hypothetical protein [Streptomyces sp. NPDC001292]|uniref:TIGR03943 family putative permease subunit n=1 Tax=Streptomyces sp. NPDC001292 TaxID=3364558 RepID=UPI00368A9CBC
MVAARHDRPAPRLAARPPRHRAAALPAARARLLQRGREDARRAAQGVGTFPPLPSGDPVDLSVAAFTSRAVYDSDRSLKGRTVRLTGFVTHGDDGAWYITRLLVSCCAADATTSKVELRGADAPATDAWVTVTGIWRPKGRLGSSAAWPPLLDAKEVRGVEEPSNPYEQR